ncbi:MAG: hypothetical protein JSV62_15725 [Promethearchaeota archaeon]|nr:MAG: hypothetical protein JSV62_15725 [Candidatus Lokiarchaeota archaeon]
MSIVKPNLNKKEREKRIDRYRNKFKNLLCVRCESTVSVIPYFYKGRFITSDVIQGKMVRNKRKDDCLVPVCDKCSDDFKKWKILRKSLIIPFILLGLFILGFGQYLVFEQRESCNAWCEGMVVYPPCGEWICLDQFFIILGGAIILTAIMFIYKGIIRGLEKKDKNPDLFIRINEHKKVMVKPISARHWIYYNRFIKLFKKPPYFCIHCQCDHFYGQIYQVHNKFADKAKSRLSNYF